MNDLGCQNIRNYCHNLALEGGNLVAKIWKTDLLTDVEDLIGNMIMVRAPNSNIEICRNVGFIVNSYLL
jgi:hypothetical protein